MKSVLLVGLLLVAASAIGQTDTMAIDYTPDYTAAIGQFYGATGEAVTMAMDAGIALDELPVLFCIAKKSEAGVESVLAKKTEVDSWQAVAEAFDLGAGDFYVNLSREPAGNEFKRTFAKFKGLQRDNFGQVKLDDADFKRLVNLRFMYRHYNYSQHLIMTWAGEGKSFPEINHLLVQVTTETPKDTEAPAAVELLEATEGE